MNTQRQTGGRDFGGDREDTVWKGTTGKKQQGKRRKDTGDDYETEYRFDWDAGCGEKHDRRIACESNEL